LLALPFGRLEPDAVEVIILLILLIGLEFEREMPGVALLDFFDNVIGPQECPAVYGKGLAIFVPDEPVAARTGILPEPESDLVNLLVKIKYNKLEPVAYHFLHMAVKRHASFVDSHIRREKHPALSAPCCQEFLVCHLLLPPFFKFQLTSKLPQDIASPI